MFIFIISSSPLLNSGARCQHLSDIFRMAFVDRFRVARLRHLQAPVEASAALHLRPLRDRLAGHFAGSTARVHRQPRRRLVFAAEPHDR